MNKKMMLLCMSAFVLFSSIAGCDSKKEMISADFVDKEWLFYDANIGEHLVMYLGSDGSFSYHCQCGEPVDDLDLYETYEYDEEKKIITILNPSDKLEKEIQIIDANEYHLLLNYDGDIIDFNREEVWLDTNFFLFEGDDYFSEYDSRCIIVELDEKEILYGPVSYDPEGLYKDGPFENYKVSEDVDIYNLLVESYNSIQEEQQYEEFYEATYEKLDLQGAKETIAHGAGYSFLWFDEELQVEKIVFYGQLSVTADYKAITIPAEFCDGISREYLDFEIEEGLYDAAHINEDGSILYLMIEEQLDKILTDMKMIYLDSLDEMCGEEHFGIVDIIVNDAFDNFEVILEDGVKQLPQQVRDNLEYMSKMYGLYCGREIEEILPIISASYCEKNER